MINPTQRVSTLAILQQHTSALKEPKEAQGLEPKKARGDVVEFDSKKLEIEAFARGVKGANEFIGALQSADIALKKMGKESEDSSPSALAKIDAIAQNSAFMGKKLFDKELRNEVNNAKFSLSLENPAKMGESMVDYINSKRAEIASTLTKVSDAISDNNLVEVGEFNFEDFDPATFKKMF